MLRIRSETDSADRLVVNSDGHVDIGGNLDVGAGLDVTGNITCTGTIPAAQLTGTLPAIDGSNLTGVTSTTINNTADNRVITGSGTANTLNGEANFTYDGTYLNYTANVNQTYPSGTDTNYMKSIANNNGIKYVFRGDGLYLGNGLTGSNQGSGPSNNNISLKTNGNITTVGSFVTTGNVYIASDSKKIHAGASNDLQIYHDGSNSYISNSTGNLRIGNTHNNNIIFRVSNANKWHIDGNGAFLPDANNSYDIGTTSNRVRNIYTNDLHLSNEGSSNDVDSTWGDWTIQEGESDLFLKNNRSGKKYKFNLTEVS